MSGDVRLSAVKGHRKVGRFAFENNPLETSHCGKFGVKGGLTGRVRLETEKVG
jgi:hypothetical protein